MGSDDAAFGCKNNTIVGRGRLIRTSIREAWSTNEIDVTVPKFSLFTLTFYLPLIVASICAIHSAYVGSVRHQATTFFHESVDNPRDHKYATGIENLVAAHGQEYAAKIVDLKAKTSQAIAFDGVSRFAKVVRQTKTWANKDAKEIGYSDGVILKDLGYPTGAIWDGPMGTRISGIRFVDDNLVVSIYGELRLGSSTRMIPQETPEDYFVPWAQGAKPMAGSWYDSVVARHQDGG